MSPVPSLEDLIWIFETEPTPSHPDQVIAGVGSADWRRDWPYTSVTFRTQRGEDTVEFAMNGGYEWVSVAVSRRGEPVVSLEMGDVASVAVERLHGSEELHVVFREPRVEMLRLRLKPTVVVAWRVLRSPPGRT